MNYSDTNNSTLKNKIDLMQVVLFNNIEKE